MADLSMDDILNDKKPEPEAVVEKTEAPVERATSRKLQWQEKEQAAQGRVRDPETGQFSPKAEEPIKEEAKAEPKEELAKTVAPQNELSPKEKALLAETDRQRARAQDLERRIAAMEAALPKEPEKTFWDDPEAALAKQKEELRKETDRLRAEAVTARLNTAEFIARREHPDFDEKIEVFGELLNETPGLHQQWMSAPDPAEFAYKTGKNHMDLKEAGGIPELRAKIEKEVRLKLEAELKEKAEKLAKERSGIPPSLSEARSTGVNKPVWGGVPSFDDILKH